LYRAFANHEGFQVVLVSKNTDILKIEFAGCRNIEFLQLPHGGTFLRLFVYFPILIRKIKPDYSHFQYVAPPLMHGKSIITMHDVLFLDFPKQFPLLYRWIRGGAFKYFARKASILTTVSNYSQMRISNCFGISKSKIHVVSNAVSDDMMISGSRETAVANVAKTWRIQNFILYVGRIEPRKNHQLLVKAYRELDLYTQGIHLVFTGKMDIHNGELEREVHRLSDDQKLGLHFFENVDDISLQQFYRACRLFVFPSFGEGFGIPLLEAAANGAPVLSSHATAMGHFGLPEQCMFSPDDFDGFCSSLKVALEYPDRFKINPGILNEYTWRNSAKKFRDLLKTDFICTKN
jgi:glycosyltransferase involved in cell wall biosynthesis